MCSQPKSIGSADNKDLDATSNFIQLVTPLGEVQVIIQRVSYEARAHLDIETDSITPAACVDVG